MRFGVDGALAFAVPIPAGTRVTTQSGGVMFATLSDAVLPAGELFVETSAKATEAGASGNGLLPGQICRLVDPLPYITRVSNVATTLSGCDEEGTSGSATASAWLRRAFPLPGRTARMKRGSRR